jgi:hypothetical protein
MKSIKILKNNSATRLTVSTIGVVLGVAGIGHGIFEVLQGNVASGGVIINAIGPAQRLWERASLHAFTIIPNLLITGILAMIAGLLFAIWAAAFINRKYGAWIMMLLSIILFLVGGGSGPLFIGIFISIIATRINKPLTWWRAHLPVNVRTFLAKSWLWSLIVYVVLYVSSVVVTITGWPLLSFFGVNTTYKIILSVGYILLGLMLFTTLTAFAYDIQKRTDSSKVSSTER